MALTDRLDLAASAHRHCDVAAPADVIPEEEIRDQSVTASTT
ncbi:hypothetical protein [Microbacterium plantarum]|nr:hypothetical protein [Microbacterium plantarum]WRK17100.1 hypothetical protein VC184_14500 [Microbacterium plantarum]